MKELLKTEAIAESWLTGMLLALVGGYLDIYSYLGRGKVFANTQTGNLVLLGYHIAIGNFPKVIYYLSAVIAFMTGIGVAKVIECKFKEGQYFAWLHIVVIIEITGIFVVMWIPADDYNMIANMTLSFICALQVQGFRKVNGNAYSTVMFTGNLKSLSERFFHFWMTKDKRALENSMIYLGIVIFFVIGGWLGALTTIEYGEKSVGIINVVLILIFILLFFEKRRKQM